MLYTILGRLSIYLSFILYIQVDNQLAKFFIYYYFLVFFYTNKNLPGFFSARISRQSCGAVSLIHSMSILSLYIALNYRINPILMQLALKNYCIPISSLALKKIPQKFETLLSLLVIYIHTYICFSMLPFFLTSIPQGGEGGGAFCIKRISL